MYSLDEGAEGQRAVQTQWWQCEVGAWDASLNWSSAQQGVARQVNGRSECPPMAIMLDITCSSMATKEFLTVQSTYCDNIRQHCETIGRTVHVVNLGVPDSMQSDGITIGSPSS